MRFLGKYELLEQLTVGSVETFLAQQIGGGEKLLIHVFAFPISAKSKGKSDLVKYMEAMSPPVLGSVLDGACYDDGSQAYLVIKYPRDSKVLSAWIESYAELSRKSERSFSSPRRTQSGNSTSQEETSDFDTSSGIKSLPPRHSPAIPNPAPSTRLPSVPKPPAQEQGAGLGEGARLWASESARQPRDKDSGLAPSRGREAPRDSGKQDEKPQSSVRPGEFTQYFKGPFVAPPASSDMLASEPIEQPGRSREAAKRQGPGEFTILFGSPNSPKEVSGEPLLEPASERAEPPLGRTPSLSADPASVDLTEDAVEQPRRPEKEFQRSPGSPGKELQLPGPSPRFGQSSDSEATQFFRPPHADAPPPVEEPAIRESEYDRIVAPRPKRNEAPVPEKEVAQGDSKFALASTPGLPSVAKPNVSVAPLPVPHGLPAKSVSVQAPSISIQSPQVAVPSPKLQIPTPAPSKKKRFRLTDHAPLIVILNMLVLCALALVLYFALAR